MIESPLTNKSALIIKTITRAATQTVIRAGKLSLALLLALATIVPTAQFAHAQGGVHTVAYGETLANIAYAHGVNSSELARANNVVNTNMLYIGQQLTIPSGGTSSASAPATAGSTTAGSTTAVTTSPTTASASSSTVAASAQPAAIGYVTVSRGDTLSQIAKDHGMSMRYLMQLNGLTNPNHVGLGQRLRVTGTAAAASSSTTTAAATTTSATTAAAASSVAHSIYVVKYRDTLSKIAARYGVSGSSIIQANGLPNANHVWVGQRLRIPGGSTAAVAQTTARPQVSQSPAAYGRKLIEVNLSKQTLTAWQGDQQMLHTYISSGTYETPTVTGRFLVSWKLSNQHMYGDDFDLPNVPWVMYFYEGYAIHGAYWHNNFGMPMSHGCVNMVPSQAQFLYEWAPVGTEIWVHY